MRCSLTLCPLSNSNFQALWKTVVFIPILGGLVTSIFGTKRQDCNPTGSFRSFFVRKHFLDTIAVSLVSTGLQHCFREMAIPSLEERNKNQSETFSNSKFVSERVCEVFRSQASGSKSYESANPFETQKLVCFLPPLHFQMHSHLGVFFKRVPECNCGK